MNHECSTSRWQALSHAQKCDAQYRVSPYRFRHPLGTATVVDWTRRTPRDFRVYPVPSKLLQRTDGPLWQDLVLGMQPEIPCPFGGYAQFILSGPDVPTTGDLTSMCYDVLLSHLRHATHGFQAWRLGARLVLIALPATVNGYVAADAGEVLIASRWPSSLMRREVVSAFCPRFSRGVVLHHSFAAVPRPVKENHVVKPKGFSS